MTLAQAVALVNEHPVAVIASLLGGATALLLAALKFIAGMFQKGVQKLEGKVDGFATSLAQHSADDDRRFGDIAATATQRHEAVMASVHRANENVTNILTPMQVQLEVMAQATPAKRRGKR